jgi:hypothetical protein
MLSVRTLHLIETIPYYRVAMIVYHLTILTTIALALMLMMTSSAEPVTEPVSLLGTMIHIDLHALLPSQSAVRMRNPANRQTIINTGMPT